MKRGGVRRLSWMTLKQHTLIKTKVKYEEKKGRYHCWIRYKQENSKKKIRILQGIVQGILKSECIIRVWIFVLLKEPKMEILDDILWVWFLQGKQYGTATSEPTLKEKILPSSLKNLTNEQAVFFLKLA